MAGDVSLEFDGGGHVVDAAADGEAITDLPRDLTAEIEDHEIGAFGDKASPEVVFIPPRSEPEGREETEGEVDPWAQRHDEVEVRRIEDLLLVAGGVAFPGVGRVAGKVLGRGDEGDTGHELRALVDLKGHPCRIPEECRRVIGHRGERAPHAEGLVAGLEQGEAGPP